MLDPQYQLVPRYLKEWPEEKCRETYEHLREVVAQGKLLVPHLALKGHHDNATSWEVQPNVMYFGPMKNAESKPLWTIDDKFICAASDPFVAVFTAAFAMPVTLSLTPDSLRTFRHTVMLFRRSKYAPNDADRTTYTIFSADDYAKAYIKDQEAKGIFLGRIFIVDPQDFEVVPGGARLQLYRGTEPITSHECIQVATPVLDLDTIDELPNVNDIPIMVRGQLQRTISH